MQKSFDLPQSRRHTKNVQTQNTPIFTLKLLGSLHLQRVWTALYLY